MKFSDNYTIYHLHTDLSNGVTNIDSVTKAEEYVNRAKELGMKALAFSEHGNVFQWTYKKALCEAAGLKYIHGVEAYLTTGEKKRDNYHCGLYAKNYAGVLEINELMSRANNRKDGHYYYTPRIKFDELFATSDNIIVTTACIGGVLYKADFSVKQKFIDFLEKNKDRCFLEVQPHLDEMQIEYNRELVELSEKIGVRLIAGTDTHALNDMHAKGRKILQKSKGIHFGDEDNWIITMMSYDELFKAFWEQCAIPEHKIYEAIENTNVLADMVEEFTLDRGFKYPKMSEAPIDTLKAEVIKGLDKRNIAEEEREYYLEKAEYELGVYEKQGAGDYLLLDKDIKDYAKRNNKYHGCSRGSVAGSVVAYLTGITDINPIKEKLNFERFMNVERISLADVDTDWKPSDRDFIKDYIFNKQGLYCADIITFNTVALKGSIRDCARALEIPLKIVDEITKGIEENELVYRSQFPELFEYVDIVNGTIVSIGTHPSGTVVSPIPLENTIGVCSLSTSERPVTALAMKEIDGLNFVKLDILGLENQGIINETCELAGIERLTPDNVVDDEEVWLALRESTVGVFQWESNTAAKYVEKLFSDETIVQIKSKNPNFRYIDLLSIGNGAIRPAGASYRDELAAGIFRDNGHKALNDFLASTLGYLVYQEQIIEFLNKFCGFTMGEADTVRRGFAKKTGTEQYIPRIKDGFIKTMQKEYGVGKDESERLIVNFLKVIEDASDYLFSLNHAQAYSYIGYMGLYLREKYPLQFLTATLNAFDNDLNKTAEVVEYIKLKGYTLNPPTFGKSRAEYFFDIEEKAIYKGIKSIKYLNESVANTLYELSKLNFKTFEDLYIYIKENSIKIQARQMKILAAIGYFRELGSSLSVVNKIEMIDRVYSKKTYKKSELTEQQHYILKMFAEKETEKMFRDIRVRDMCKYLSEKISNEEYPINKLVAFQLEYMGNTTIVAPEQDKKVCVVVDINLTYTPAIKLYQVATGKMIEVKVFKKDYVLNPLELFDEIFVYNVTRTPKRRFDKELEKWVETGEMNLNILYNITNRN